MSKNRLDFTANLGRHSHDTSAGYTSSIAPGCLVPQYWDILGPNDKVFFKTHMFCRFKDIPRPFLGEVSLHLDYFFVPAQMLYTLFGQVFAQTDDVISDYFANVNTDLLDQFPIIDLESYFNNTDRHDQLVSDVSPYNYDDCLLHGNFRLLDALNINPLVCNVSYYTAHPSDDVPPHKVFVGFPFALGAYQAIYQKYYRNDEIEKFDILSFNVDGCALTSDKTIPNDTVKRLTTLRYAGRPNDYFTNVRFSPIASSINALGNTRNVFVDGGINGGDTNYFNTLVSKVSDFLGVKSDFLPQQAKANNFERALEGNKFGSVISSNENADPTFAFFSAQNIRAVFALDKYMRVYGRAGKTYDDQILAHFGVKIPHDVKHDITHIKHYRMVLQSDPVISTADTSDGSVGSVGGQLAAEFNSQHEESFTAPVHGVFMCIAHVVTHPRYFLTNDRLHGIAERLQLPIPEFDKLGAQPLNQYEFGHDGTTPSSYSGVWKNRYAEFKEKYNRVSITYAHDLTPNYQANFYSPWVVSRIPYSDPNFYNRYNAPRFKSFFEAPSSLNNVMSVKYNGFWDAQFNTSPHLTLQTDPILTEFACFAKKVSWMSPTGEPDL